LRFLKRQIFHRFLLVVVGDHARPSYSNMLVIPTHPSLCSPVSVWRVTTPLRHRRRVSYHSSDFDIRCTCSRTSSATLRRCFSIVIIAICFGTLVHARFRSHKRNLVQIYHPSSQYSTYQFTYKWSDQFVQCCKSRHAGAGHRQYSSIFQLWNFSNSDQESIITVFQQNDVPRFFFLSDIYIYIHVRWRNEQI